MNGYALQTYVFADATRHGIPLGIWVAQRHGLSVALSIWTVVFELGFVTSLFIPWTVPYWMVAAILFHIGLYAVAGHVFTEHVVLLALLLVFGVPSERYAAVAGASARENTRRSTVRAAQ